MSNPLYNRKYTLETVLFHRTSPIQLSHPATHVKITVDHTNEVANITNKHITPPLSFVSCAAISFLVFTYTILMW